MLKLSCNVADTQFQAVSQCRFLIHPQKTDLDSSNRRRNGVVSYRLEGRRGGGRRIRGSAHLQAVVSEQQGSANQFDVDCAASLANQLRMGAMEEDRFSFKEKFIVRCYEVGINKTATVETIANLLQEVACNHAQAVGFSIDGFATTLSMRKLNLIWVTARMHIEIYKYPAWSDVVEIETWIQSEGRIGTRRDWILRDYANGQVIGRATSKWVMMNQDTRRLQKCTDEVREEYLVFCPPVPRLAFPEKNNNSLKKILKLEHPAQHIRTGLEPRRSDLDMNQHVNNVAYIGWVLESIPQEIIDTHELEALTLDYRRECQQGDVVDSLTSLEPEDETKPLSMLKATNGAPSAKQDEQDYRKFLHMLTLSGNGQEINRGRTEWRKKPSR